MFFILDETKRADIIRDEGRNITYQVLDVIKLRERNLSKSSIDSSAYSSEVTSNSSDSSDEY